MMWPLGFAFVFFLWTALSACTRGEPTVVAIAVHPINPDIVYVSTSQGVVKSRDGGSTWTSLSEGLENSQVLAFAIVPNSPSTVFAGTFAKAIYKSSDGGQRWMPANIGMKEHVSVVNAIVFYPQDPNIVYAATTVGVYRSDDDGASWVETVHGMESVYTVALAFDPHDPNILYAGTSGGMYKSSDRGTRWTLINRGLIEGNVGTAMALGVNAISIDPVHTDHVVIATGKGIAITQDGGAQWTARPTGDRPSFMTALQRDTQDPTRLYAGGEAGLFISTDGGETWTSVGSEPLLRVVRAIAIAPSKPAVVYIGTQKGLFQSTDRGQTWKRLSGLRGS